jgi:hypothetical protein
MTTLQNSQLNQPCSLRIHSITILLIHNCSHVSKSKKQPTDLSRWRMCVCICRQGSRILWSHVDTEPCLVSRKFQLRADVPFLDNTKLEQIYHIHDAGIRPLRPTLGPFAKIRHEACNPGERSWAPPFMPLATSALFLSRSLSLFLSSFFLPCQYFFKCT